MSDASDDGRRSIGFGLLGALAIIIALCLGMVLGNAPTIKEKVLQLSLFFSGNKDSAAQRALLFERYGKEGGLLLELRVQLPVEKGSDDDEKVRNQAREIVINRLDLIGINNCSVMALGDNKLEIIIPGIDEVEQALAREMIMSSDLLTFHELRNQGESEDMVQLMGRKGKDDLLLPEVQSKDKSKKARWYLVAKNSLIGTTDLESARVGFDDMRGTPKILLKFSPAGTKRFEEVTTQYIGKRLTMVLGGKVYMAPVIREPIREGMAEISGNFDLDEARRVTSVLKAGCLPCTLVPTE